MGGIVELQRGDGALVDVLHKPRLRIPFRVWRLVATMEIRGGKGEGGGIERAGEGCDSREGKSGCRIAGHGSCTGGVPGGGQGMDDVSRKEGFCERTIH